MFALNRGTVELLQRIDAWPAITAIRHRPVRRMQVWDARSDAMIAFGGAAIAADMAYIVENDVLLHAVLEQLNSGDVARQVRVQNGSRIEAVELATGAGERGAVRLQTGEEFSCDLLVSSGGQATRLLVIVSAKVGVQ